MPYVGGRRSDRVTPPIIPVVLRRLAARPLVPAFAVSALVYLAVIGPPVSPWNATWGGSIIAGTPRQIWLSAHLGQVFDYAVATALGRDAHAAMRIVSYALGLLYLAAAALLAGTLPGRRGPILFVLAAISPITVYLHGSEELGFYPFPLLALALALRGRERPGSGRGLTVVLLSGVAAATHGIGLFFLPGLVAMNVLPALLAAGRTVKARLTEAFTQAAATAAAYFGPSGALLILYVLIFRTAIIIPGDTSGGSQGASVLLPFQSFPAHSIGGVDYRAYSFFSLDHLIDAVLYVTLGAPALILLVLLVAGLRGDRRRRLVAAVRAERERWALAAGGLVIAIVSFPAAGQLSGLYAHVPAMILLQLLALATIVEHLDPRWAAPLTGTATLGVTAFVWWRQSLGML